MCRATKSKEKDVRIHEIIATSVHLPASDQLSPADLPKVAINIPSFQTLSRTSKIDQTVSSDLSSKLIGDVLVAFGVTFGMSPFVSIIDKSVVQRAAGTHSILQSGLESMTSILRNPYAYIKSPTFLMMWAVYAATYSTANCSKTIFEHTQMFGTSVASKDDERNEKLGIFLGTTAVNSTFSMLKDKFYAMHFGASNAPARIPLITYGLWGARDCITIGSSFLLPDIVSNLLEQETDLDKNVALRVSQMACPIGMQLIVSPVQMLGLDFYNRPMKNSSYKHAIIERYVFVRNNYTSIVTARVARIAPAFGIGGIGNTYFRDLWRDRVLEKELDLVDLTVL